MSDLLLQFFTSLFYSRRGPYPLVRKGFLLLGVAGLGFVLFKLFRPVDSRRDYWQDYLMARAFLAGFNPYLPVSALPELLGVKLEYTLWEHPSPHPPLVIFLNLPLGLLPAQFAHMVFNCLQLFVLWLLARELLSLFPLREQVWRGRQNSLFVLLLLCPFMYGELLLGQINLFVLYLLLCSLRFEQDSRPILSGVLLAVALSLKASFAVVVFAFLFSKRWKVLLSFGLAFLCLHLLLMGVLGVTVVKDYYLLVSPMVSTFYLREPINISLWTFPPSLFFGSRNLFSGYFDTPPCFSPEFQSYYNPLRYLVIVLAFISVVVSLRFRSFKLQFLYLLALSALLSPIVWEQGLLYVLPLMFYLWVDWFNRGALAREFAVLLLLSLFTLLALPFTSIGEEGGLIVASSCMPDLLIAKQAFFKIAACLIYFYSRELSLSKRV